MGFKRPEVRIFSPRPLKIGNHYDFRFFLCQNIFSESFQKPPIFQFRGSNFSTFCFYGKRKNSKELNDCSIKNRVKRHEKTFSLLVHTSSGQDPPIFSATNRLLACVPIPEGCLRAPLQRHEDRLCAARLQNWTGTVSVNFCAKLFRRKTKFRRVLPSLRINSF